MGMVKFMGPTLKFLVGAVICRKSEARHFKFGLENVENDFFWISHGKVATYDR